MRQERIDGPYILTASGLYVNPLELKPAQIRLLDVAHALSHQCRFTGHTSSFYSVAEHSVRVVWWLRNQGASRADQQWGLLHDASEAYLIDMARPLKVDPYFGKAYRGAEGRAMAVVCEAFGLPAKAPELVHKADAALLAAERRDLLPAGGEWVVLDGVEPAPGVIVPWSPRLAKRRFIDEYVRLFEVAERKPSDTASTSVPEHPWHAGLQVAAPAASRARSRKRDEHHR